MRAVSRWRWHSVPSLSCSVVRAAALACDFLLLAVRSCGSPPFIPARP